MSNTMREVLSNAIPVLAEVAKRGIYELSDEAADCAAELEALMGSADAGAEPVAGKRSYRHAWEKNAGRMVRPGVLASRCTNCGLEKSREGSGWLFWSREEGSMGMTTPACHPNAHPLPAKSGAAQQLRDDGEPFFGHPSHQWTNNGSMEECNACGAYVCNFDHGGPGYDLPCPKAAAAPPPPASSGVVDDRCVIWSGEHRTWWRAGANGYTTNIAEAGVYARAEAERLLSGCGPEKKLEIQSAPALLSAADVAVAIRAHAKDWKEAAEEGVSGSRIGAGALRGVAVQIAALLPEPQRGQFIKQASGEGA